MNCFVLSFRANIGLKYDGRALPKIERNSFSASNNGGKKRKENCAMKEALSSQQSAVSKKEAVRNQHSTFSQNQEQQKNLLTPQQRAEALVRRIGETCDELDNLAEENPGLVGRVARSAEEHKDAYLRLKARLELANMAPRCRWVKQDGASCGSPQMKQHIYCFAHMQMAEARTLLLLLPPPEDANAIQVGLMRIQKAMIEDTISTKKAGLLLYSMQLALTNVGQTTFGKAKDDEMVRETVSEEEAINEEARKNQHPIFSEGQNQHQNQTFETRRNGGRGGAERLPVMDADDADRQGLPRMDADDREFKGGIKPVEWRPTPDMYRTDTPEGREAYEACLRMTAARLGAERRPPQPVITPEDRAETHAVLG
jgi:hypothetical protein